jgi:hypothetical protein
MITAARTVFGEMLNHLAVWAKTNAGMGSFYRSQYELIGVFRVGRAAHCNNVELGRFERNPIAHRHKIWSEAYMEIKGVLRLLWESGSMGSSVIRLKNRGRLDFWTLGNEIAGRSRRYRRVVIDEAAFAKNGDNKVDGSMMEIWEKAIKPTLFDYGGEVLICSNSAGKNPDNFFYNICTDPN